MTTPPGTPRTISVASGKGGVGKTWFAITLSHALARLGRRVLLFDGDIGLANVDVQLGFAPRTGLADVLAGMPMAEAVQPFPAGGFDVLGGSSGSGALAGLDPARLEEVLDGLARLPGYDHVVLDLGAGLEAGVRRMLAWADAAVVLATSDPTSITDAYATLKLHAADRPRNPARLVINAAATPAAADRTADTILRACAAFLGMRPALLGRVHRDPLVAEAIRRQVPLLVRSPHCQAANDVERIAAAI